LKKLHRGRRRGILEVSGKVTKEKTGPLKLVERSGNFASVGQFRKVKIR